MNFNNKVLNLNPYNISNRFGSSTNNDKIILDWNESTKIFSDKLVEDIKEISTNTQFNFYGDVKCIRLNKSLSNYLGMPSSFVSVFNGSDSALNIVFECILEPNDFVLKYEPDYSQVDVFITMKGGKIITVTNQNVFKKDIGIIKKALQSKNITAFYFSNPNNPTGKIFSYNEIEQLLIENTQTWFLIDEAYVEFSSQSSIRLAENYDNVIIFRSFSKAFGLAGLRIGYIVSGEENIYHINKVRNGKEVSAFSQEVSTAALRYIDDLENHMRNIKKIKNWFCRKLSSIESIEVRNTHTNFIIIKHKRNSEIVDYLSSKDIFIRDRSSLVGMNNCSRITIGTMKEMEKVYDVLLDFLN